jgi:hypothetical protein
MGELIEFPGNKNKKQEKNEAASNDAEKEEKRYVTSGDDWLEYQSNKIALKEQEEKARIDKLTKELMRPRLIISSKSDELREKNGHGPEGDFHLESEQFEIKSTREANELLLSLGFTDVKKDDIYELQMIYPKNAEKKGYGIVAVKIKGAKLQISINGPQFSKDWETYRKTKGKLEVLSKMEAEDCPDIGRGGNSENLEEIVTVIRKLVDFQAETVDLSMEISFLLSTGVQRQKFDLLPKKEQGEVIDRYKDHLPKCKEFLSLFSEYRKEMEKLNETNVSFDPLQYDIRYILGDKWDKNKEHTGIAASVRRLDNLIHELENNMESEHHKTK